MSNTGRGSTCIILTADNRILLQLRDDLPDHVSRFGGGLEGNETHIEGMKRELKEELGADIEDAELYFLGHLPGTNKLTGRAYMDAIYFWHDAHGKITGVYEGFAAYYENHTAALADKRLSENTRAAIFMAKEKGFLI